MTAELATRPSAASHVSQAIDRVDRNDDALALSPISDVAGAQGRLRQLQAFVTSVMVEGHDYGTIPGTDKPALYKPGAEKLLEIYGLGATIEVTHRIEDWDRGFWHYETRCTIRSRRTGDVVGEGVGSCNSMESRYRWRVEWNNNAPTNRPVGDGWELVRTKRGQAWKRRTENQDRWDLPNTILKMSKKRSLVDASLSVTRSSGLFTQDIEDLAPVHREDDGNDALAAPPAARPQAPVTVRPAPATPATVAKDDDRITPSRAADMQRAILGLVRNQGFGEAEAIVAADSWALREMDRLGKDGLADLTVSEARALYARAQAADFAPPTLDDRPELAHDAAMDESPF